MRWISGFTFAVIAAVGCTGTAPTPDTDVSGTWLGTYAAPENAMGTGSTESLWLLDDSGSVAGDLTITGDSTIPNPSYAIVRGWHADDSMTVSYADPRYGFCRLDGQVDTEFGRYDAVRWCRVPDTRDTVTFELQPEDSTSNEPPKTVGTIPAAEMVVGGLRHRGPVGRFFTDPDGDSLTYTVRSLKPSVASAVLDSTSIAITGKAAGSTTVRIRATDPGGLFAEQSVGVTVLESCSEQPYNRADWGTYPAADSTADPTWTQPHDSVNNPKITQDHHVALKDAHLSGGCHWSDEKKDRFSSYAANLNPTAGSFNSSKGSRTPDKLTGIAKRIIDTPPEKCRYALQHQAVKAHWQLIMTTAETAIVVSWLRGCTS
ncbi:MAG: hypothetical protein OXQ93_16805 [Gemmatimonadota bacterium]|nr:hypothetical protein [Gemmatimonadota bacterium]